MSNEIIKVLDDLAERFGVMIDWSQENVLPYVMDIFDRLITYRIATISIQLIINLVVGIAIIIVLSKSYKKYTSKYREYIEYRRTQQLDPSKDKTFIEFIDYWKDGWLTPLFIVTTVVSGASVTLFMSNLFNLIEILILPELYVIDFITNLM